MKKSSSKNTKKLNTQIKVFIGIAVIAAVVAIGVFVWPKKPAVNPQNPNAGTQASGTDAGLSVSGGAETPDPVTTEEEFSLEDFNGYLGNDPNLQDHPKAPERTWVQNLQIPEYSGEAYISLNDGMPFFKTENLDATPWEIYYDLDELGRCTLAEGVFGTETMPTEKRGSISSIKPSGWHSDKYPKEIVNGESLYNRCHLVAFGMSGETANKYNLVTGTRYFNTDGINAQENMMIDYIRETGNHVRYRVTPVFSGENLVCDGQVVEAWSVEDEGDGICFCIWAYNVQPGVFIDYLTGDNHLIGDEGNVPSEAEEESSEEEELKFLLDEDIIGEFVLNTKKKKIHSKNCEGAAGISEKNRKEYTGSYNELIRQGYEPDSACLEEILGEQ